MRALDLAQMVLDYAHRERPTRLIVSSMALHVLGVELQRLAKERGDVMLCDEQARPLFAGVPMVVDSGLRGFTIRAE